MRCGAKSPLWPKPDVPALYAGCRHHVRQVVCRILGIDDEPEDVAEKA